jgi:hypothetical protein
MEAGAGLFFMKQGAHRKIIRTIIHLRPHSSVFQLECDPSVFLHHRRTIGIKLKLTWSDKRTQEAVAD